MRRTGVGLGVYGDGAHAQPLGGVDDAPGDLADGNAQGAQRCGQSLGAIAAKMGNGIWTTEIIPAEIQPPARSVARRLAASACSESSPAARVAATVEAIPPPARAMSS